MKAKGEKMMEPILLVGTAAGSRASITPVQKVLDMLTGMKTKGEKMLEAEKATAAKYTEWVDDQTKEYGFEIKTANAKIEELIAFAEKADSDVKNFAKEIKALENDVDRMEGELKDA